jgi:S-adenosylmethionine:tRNA ribosyltransferase-isomerase
MADTRTKDFEYDLPRELVAFAPAERREESRLIVLDRGTGSVRHERFADIVSHFRPGDLLVVNDTRVIKARLEGKKRATGGRVELLLLKEVRPGTWEVLVSPSRRIHADTEIEIEGGYSCRVIERLAGARRTVRFSSDDVMAVLDKVGKVPLPPYIKRSPEDFDIERYQTVYADKIGSIAAPTAGLHFSESLLDEIRERGVEVASLTLHVGIGSFLPVKAEDPRRHHLEPEYFHVDSACCRSVLRARGAGGRVFAVGTTSVRALETVADRFPDGALEPMSGWTEKFIYPPFEFRVVDVLVTNLHLPRSTLLMLVCAFAGRRFILDAYNEAIRLRYRFFSYGDGMLIL